MKENATTLPWSEQSKKGKPAVESLKGEFGQDPLFPEFDIEALNQDTRMIEDNFDDALTPEPKKKKSLRDILELARKADDDFDEVEIDLDELGKDLRNKIDAIVEYIRRCESRSKDLKELADEFCKKAKAIGNKGERLEAWVAQQMIFDADLRFNEHGIRDEKPRLSGDKFEIQLKYSERVNAPKEPNASLYMKFGNALIRRSYAWDKPSLRKAIKENNTDVLEHAQIERVPQIKINPKG